MMQTSAHSDCFINTHKTILRAQKSVQANIEFVEPCYQRH